MSFILFLTHVIAHIVNINLFITYANKYDFLIFLVLPLNDRKSLNKQKTEIHI